MRFLSALLRTDALCIALIGLVWLTVTPTAQADLNGDWTVSFNTPNGNIDASVTFKQDGEALSGKISSQAGETAFKGSVKGKTFTIAFDVQTPNGNISITMNGEHEGDDIKGTFDFGQGTGDWMGKRKS